MSRISQQELESYLWGAATLLRGTIDAGDYKQFIFPLLFYKRLCDVYDEETRTALEESGGDQDYAAYPENHRFQIPPEAHWSETRKVTRNVGTALQSSLRAIEIANQDKLYGIFGDAQWTNKNRLPDAMLRDLIEHFSSLDLTIANLPEDELGNGYEYLIKKFADDSGHTAAEFYTNRTVVHLMTELLKPQPGESVYDPTCGSGGMLLSCIAHLKQQGREWRNLRLYGQERNLMTSSIARMNCFLHGVEDFKIERGDTLGDPKFVQGDRLQQFDIVLANPPYSIKQWDRETFASDPWGRNIFGTPPQGRADYAFWQHIIKSMDPKTGRCAILFPHGVLFRKEEAEMRCKLIEADLIECIIGLGPNLFYNSPMQSCVLVCRTNKPNERQGKTLFIDAVNEVTRERAQSFLTDEHIEHITSSYTKFKDAQNFARVVSIEEIRRNDHVLNIPLYVQGEQCNILKQSTDMLELDTSIKAWRDSANEVRKNLSKLLNNVKQEEDEAWPLRAIKIPDWYDRSKWRKVTLDEVADEISERVDDPSSSGVERFVGLEHFDSGDIKIRRWGSTSNLISSMKKFSSGDTLFARRNAYLRRASMADFDGLCSGDAIVLREKEGQLVKGFLPLILNTDRFWNFAVANAAGTMSRRVNVKTLEKYEFELPPLDQQIRIVNILMQVDKCAEKNLALAKALKRTFSPIFTKVLTMGLKDAEQKNTSIGPMPENWSTMYIRELVKKEDHALLAGPFGTIFKAKDFRKEGIRIIQLRHVTLDGFVWGENETYMDLDVYNKLHKPYTVNPGDLLITKMGEPPGIACIYPEGAPTAMVTPDVVKATIDETIADTRFLKYLYNSPIMRNQVAKLVKGGTRPRVSLNEFFDLMLPIPPLNEQKEIADLGDQMEASVNSAELAAVDLNTLLKTFIGALITP